MTFCHLNLHTDRSLMRGMIKPAHLVEWSKTNGVKVAAVTDFGNLSAAPELYKACKGTVVKPIYGMEVYIAPDKTDRKPGAHTIVLLAKNKAGFKNLVKLATIGAMYFYYIPRIDMGDLAVCSEGVVALTGDLRGLAAAKFFSEQQGGLDSLRNTYTDIFGDDVYWELEPVLSDSQRVYNEFLVNWSLNTPGVKLILTGDPHYMRVEDAVLHETFTAIKNWRNPGWEYSFRGPYHVRTRDEMVAQMAELHGYDVSYSPGYKEAFAAPDEIIDKVEEFDIREGVKIPSAK